MKKEDFDKIFDEIRVVIGDESSALISDKILDIMTGIEAIIIASEDLTKNVSELDEKNKNLIKANADLFSKVGKSEVKKTESEIETDEDEDEEIKLEDIINEKGEVI